MFGSGNREIKDATSIKIDKIARKHGYVLNNPKLPEGWRYWFAGPNRGNPFDQAAEEAIWADLETAGLADGKGLVEACFVRPRAR